MIVNQKQIQKRDGRCLLDGKIWDSLFCQFRSFGHESRGKYWNFHFATIGIVGMNEALLNFMGKPITHPRARKFAMDILEYMRVRIRDIQENTGSMYNLEATPAESASYRLAKIDKKKYPEMITGGKRVPYYTNSVHPPVDLLDDIFDILRHQDDLQVKFTGGTVVHLFLGEYIKDWRLVRELTRKISNQFKVPYFSFTPTFSISPSTGYIPGAHRYDPRPQKEEDLETYGQEITGPVNSAKRIYRRCCHQWWRAIDSPGLIEFD